MADWYLLCSMGNLLRRGRVPKDGFPDGDGWYRLATKEEAQASLAGCQYYQLRGSGYMTDPDLQVGMEEYVRVVLEKLP